jgi:hypothetical protein
MIGGSIAYLKTTQQPGYRDCNEMGAIGMRLVEL